MQNENTLPVNEVVSILQKLHKDKFWGSLVVFFKNGAICFCETKQQIKGNGEIFTL